MCQQKRQRRKKLSKNEPDLDYWEEIFNSVDMEILPVEYMNKIIIRFRDGTTWDIDIKDSKKKQTIEDIELSLNELFETYEDSIVNIDFRMDMDRIRKDLQRRVKRFLKLNK